MDHTVLETLQRCETEVVYRHIRHLTSPEESLAAFFGRVVHEGIRVLYAAERGMPPIEDYDSRGCGGSGVGGGAQTSSPTVPEPKFLTVFQERVPTFPAITAATLESAGSASQETQAPTVVGHVCADDKSPRALLSPADLAADAALTYWRIETESERVRLAPPGPKPDHRTPELAAAIVRVYASLYGNAASRGYDVVMNERYLASGQECGIVDRVVRRRADGLLYVLDLKTSSWAPNKGYWRQWSNSQQAAIYLDLVADAYGEQPAGFWCDHIFVSGRKAGPEPGDFMQFGPVTYSEAKRTELREQRLQWREHFRKLLGGQAAQQSTRSCFRFNSACPYLGYCSADPGDREAMIQRDLQVGTLVERPWRPEDRE